MSTPATQGSSKRKRPIISSSDDEDVTPQIVNVDVERVASTSSQRKETEQEVQSLLLPRRGEEFQNEMCCSGPILNKLKTLSCNL